MPHAPSRTKFGQDMSTLAATTQRQRTEKDGIDYLKESIIGKDCRENSVIMLGVMIGDDITVGAGSVVTRNIQNSSMAVGSPARMIRKAEAVTDMAQKRYRINTSCAW
jgi:acetyltransferase-like isoleucine patch superfamily enzyme